MSSIKTILENLDNLNRPTSIVAEPIEESQEDLMLKEWLAFKENQQLDEVLPALAAVGGALARGAAATGGAIARGIGSLAQTAGKTAAQTAGAAIGQAVADKVTGQPASQTTTPQNQQQQQQQQQKVELDKQTKSTATNLQALKSATGADINVPASTASLVKAVAGQPMSTTDSKNLSGISGAFHTALTNPNTAKQLVDIVKRATIQK
jgi:hypothetical protein